MKKVAIIGKTSHIGLAICDYLQSFDYDVRLINSRDQEWENIDFSPYCCIIHVAAIVHKPHIRDEQLYKKTNTELPYNVALKAKAEGVQHFVFISTMGVYSQTKSTSVKNCVINENSELGSSSLYGKSKLEAEQLLMTLVDSSFKISIIRPPNVYSDRWESKYISNFVKFVKILPFIPDAYGNIKQSFLFSENLAELCRILIDKELEGVYCPQDDKAVSSTELMCSIAKALEVKRSRSKVLGLGIYLLSFLPIVKKAYGGISYTKELSTISENYIVCPFDEAIGRSIRSNHS